MSTPPFGKYIILAELGHGGFATVYRAHDPDLERDIALKVLHPHFMGDPTFVARFRREAKAMAGLRHPHIITIYESGEVEGRLYIAMELAEGPSLAQHIRDKGRLSWAETLALIKPILAALAYAHERGIVHRDLKTANVLIDRERGPLLTDFGIIRLLEGSSASLSMSMGSGILGTPAYTAPEIWDGQKATPQADIYALGCMLYEMITGEVLFAGPTPMQTMRAHDRGPQLPASWPADVPDGIVDVLGKALAHAPENRYPDALQLTSGIAALSIDRLANLYASLEVHITTAEWEQAISISDEIMAVDSNYRAVDALRYRAHKGLLDHGGRPQDTGPEVSSEGDGVQDNSGPNVAALPSPTSLSHSLSTPAIPRHPNLNYPYLSPKPQTFRDLPTKELVIPELPELPEPRPDTSKREILITGLALILLIMAGFWLFNSEQAIIILSFSIVLAISTYFVISNRKQIRIIDYQEGIKRRYSRYLDVLRIIESDLERMAQDQRDVMNMNHPSAEMCFDRVKQFDSSQLWTRKIAPERILKVRVGSGNSPAAFKLTGPQSIESAVSDPLLKAVQELKEVYQNVSDAPVHLALPLAKAVGLVGPREKVVGLARSFLVQLSAQYSPRDLKFVALLSENESDEWGWLRWLPHSWSPNRASRWLASAETDRESVFSQLRKEYPDHFTKNQSSYPPQPLFVLLATDASFLEEDSVKHILSEAQFISGACALVLLSPESGIPEICRSVIEIRGDGGGEIRFVDANELIGQKFDSYDFISLADADRFARLMAPIKLATHESIDKKNRLL